MNQDLKGNGVYHNSLCSIPPMKLLKARMECPYLEEGVYVSDSSWRYEFTLSELEDKGCFFPLKRDENVPPVTIDAMVAQSLMPEHILFTGEHLTEKSMKHFRRCVHLWHEGRNFQIVDLVAQYDGAALQYQDGDAWLQIDGENEDTKKILSWWNSSVRSQ